MTLAATVAPLAAFAIVFQTVVYFSLPSRIRSMWAPVVTGTVGAAITIAAGILFGFDTIGITGGDFGATLLWGLATVIVMSAIGVVVLSRESLRDNLADPRLARLSRRQALTQILVRIPVATALIEEAFFRGVLHAALMALYPTGVAVWIGAALFGMWHVAPGVDQARAGDTPTSSNVVHTVLTVIATTIAGAVLIWLRIETGSIWAPFAVHAGINMTMAVFSRLAARRLSSQPA